MKTISLCLIACCAAASVHASVPRDFRPASDSEVLEVLPERIKRSASTPAEAVLSARRWINLSRETSDPRYLGRAQGVLSAWWSKADAPVEIAILQATIEQSLHHFDRAANTLQSALKRDPSQVQGWLTMATLDRVAARYPQSEQSCRNVARHGEAVYATICILESKSLQGQQDQARTGLTALLEQVREPVTQGWILSLLGESEERAGRDGAAEAAYRRSLALAPDGYTSLAYADLLIRLGRQRAALDVLKSQPATDAVLLRRAYALRIAKDPAWQFLSADLKSRYAAIEARGDELDAHARERALQALWLDQDAATAWRAAQANLKRQKEPLDWYLALQTSEMAGETASHKDVVQALKRSGLQDARLSKWSPRRTK